MNPDRKSASGLFSNPILIGTITVLVVIIAVYLSYIAENGLPFVATYDVSVDVSDAAELTKNADVRIGGTRVGQVLTIRAETATRTWPHPFARLGLALNRNLDPLAPDTRYQVRLASVLGAKYLEILPGRLKHGGLPEGGTFTLNTNPRLNHNIPFVDLDTSFSTFGPKTQRGVRAVIGELGPAFAGRGSQLNDAIHSLRGLMAPLEDLLRLVTVPSTRLSQLISGAATTFGALAAVAPRIDDLLADGAATFAALRRSALGETLDQLPPTESTATTVLRRSLPVLANAAGIARSLKPAAAELPLAAERTDEILTSATPVFGRVPALSNNLRRAASAVNAVAADPAASQSFKVLGSNDLATFGSSAVVGLGAIIRSVASAQFSCNVAGLWLHNFDSSLSEGDSAGPWLRLLPILDSSQFFAVSRPLPELHLNYYPIENASQCQAGNEPYSAGQLIGNPKQTPATVDDTRPPAGVLKRAAGAGLVP